jgi:hypothetical protein
MMMSTWMLAVSDKAMSLKPSAGVASYIQVDPKPIVCLRARLRLGVALTPQRRFIYKQVPSPLCLRCLVVGSTDHILLHCLHFSRSRASCIELLRGLCFSVDLTLELVLGDPPLTPAAYRGERAFLKSIHEQCLNITGDFLLSINRTMPL